MRRFPNLVLVLALGAGACGTASPPATSTPSPASVTAGVDSSTVPPSSTTTLPATTLTTVPAPTTTTPIAPDRQMLDRSVLTLGLNDETSGRFQLIPNQESRLSWTTGSYWVLPDGNVYTRFDLDAGLIRDEMEGLVGRLSAHPDLAGTDLISALQNHYVGNEFQIGITDVVRWYDLRVPSLELLVQANLVMGAGVFSGGSVPPDCEESLAAYETAARDWVADLDPKVDAAGTWVFPVEGLDTALADLVAELDSCGRVIDEASAPPQVEFRVTALGDSTMVEVLADDGLYTDHEPAPVFTVMMQPDAAVNEPAEPLDPAPLLGIASTYLAAIGACGELPWAHTDMAGGDSWVDPAEEPFLGITFLADRLECAGDVPGDAVSP